MAILESTLSTLFRIPSRKGFMLENIKKIDIAVQLNYGQFLRVLYLVILYILRT